MFRKRALSNGLIGAQVGETLKVGYLRKKGHVRRNWLDRWFVLTTEGLYYYKAKGVSVLQSVDVSSVKGSLINLKCDSLVSFYAACNLSLYESRVCS